ncbi:MAG: hypothetical protein ACC707_04935 [Thiohalomonadales bacterium]
MIIKVFQLILFILILAGCVGTGQVRSYLPDKPNVKTKYLFWMHGIRLEDLGPDHKRVKNYEIIVDTLASNGFYVITEHREVVIIESYAKIIANQVRELLKKGVPPVNITVSGYSKGSLITAAVSSELANPRINYVLVSGCTDRYDLDYSNVKGRILSIYDKGDEGWFSCAKRINAKDADVEFSEIEILMGKGHKGFRLPKSKFMDQWQTPLFDWVK